MKLTASGLRKLIKEEARRLMSEAGDRGTQDVLDEIQSLMSGEYVNVVWVIEGLDEWMREYREVLEGERELRQDDVDFEETAPNLRASSERDLVDIDADLAAMDAGTFDLLGRKYKFNYRNAGLDRPPGSTLSFVVDRDNSVEDSYTLSRKIGDKERVLGRDLTADAVMDLLDREVSGPGFFETRM
jgi:hypothetical protein